MTQAPAGARVQSLHHVQLAMPPGVEHEQQAVDFYEGVLGIPRVPKPVALAGRGGAWFEDGALRVHLGVEADFGPAAKAHPGLVVDDFASMERALRAAGAPVTKGEERDGLRSIYTADPFGNRIELLG